MKMYDIIDRKKKGLRNSDEEIALLVRGYVDGEIPDYQVAAWLMAVCLNGLDKDETVSLTGEMIRSGDQVVLDDIPGIKVDKHSSGGVGDKTSLVVAPIVASTGIVVAKMSGRGLGHTGGTIDKLEAIPGFRTGLDTEEFFSQAAEIGIAITGQTGNMVPADKKLYALRDVTATVDSIPLIASSIMSKKIASGAEGIVLDVKAGSGAFMKTREEAAKLAREMVDLGNAFGRKTVAMVTAMDEPLGNAVGNSLEVREAVQTLRGGGPADFRELCLQVAAHMIHTGRPGTSLEEAYAEAGEAVAEGSAFRKFLEFIKAQGYTGDGESLDRDLCVAEKVDELILPAEGYVKSIDAEKAGLAAMELGAGRRIKTDSIDYGVGIIFRAKTGDYLARGQVAAEIYYRNEETLAASRDILLTAYEISSEIPEKKPVVHEVIF